MADEQSKVQTEAESELQREIRAGRKFTLADAIGRLAGPGMMKGVSPVTREQQALAEIKEYLERNLINSGGVLAGILLRQIAGNELLLNSLDQPLVAVARYVQRILGSEYGLKELVREADVEWGRMFGERPYFEKEGATPDPDDPYTLESVRTALTQLASGLTSGA